MFVSLFFLSHFILSAVSIAAVAQKEPKTIITGDQMEIGSKGQMVIFTGNAKVSRGKNVLVADRIVQDKNKSLYSQTH